MVRCRHSANLLTPCGHANCSWWHDFISDVRSRGGGRYAAPRRCRPVRDVFVASAGRFILESFKLLPPRLPAAGGNLNLSMSETSFQLQTDHGGVAGCLHRRVEIL